jgi:hypothetical protein
MIMIIIIFKNKQHVLKEKRARETEADRQRDNHPPRGRKKRQI